VTKQQDGQKLCAVENILDENDERIEKLAKSLSLSCKLTGDESRVRQISFLRIEILHIDFLKYILFL